MLDYYFLTMQALLLRYDKHIGYNMKQEIQKRIDQIKAGQIPDGYSRTSLGIFPCDWEIDKSFSELFSFHSNLGKSREELGDNGICYLHYGDMHRNSSYIAKYSDYLYEPKYDISLFGKEDFLMQDGDIAFLDASEDLSGTSRAVLIDNPDNEPFIAGLHTILAKERGTAFAKYFKQYITISQDVRKQFQRLAVGFKVYGLNKDTLGWIRISYPKSIKEQEKIAQILMTWDKVIELQEKYIEVLLKKRKYFLQCLFNQNLCSKHIQLGDYVVQRNHRNRFRTIKNVKSVSNTRGFIDQSEQFSKIVASEDMSNYKIVKQNYIAYNPSRINVGSIALYEGVTDCIVSPMYIVFSCKNISPKFLLLLLETERGWYEIKSHLSGSVRNSLSFDDLRDITLPLPKEDSLYIVQLFETIDKEISIKNKYLEKLKEQRKSLQQLLLTGIVRV